MTKKLSFSLNVIKDYPKPGINFLDINPLLANPEQFHAVTDACCAAVQNAITQEEFPRTALISPEARGFIFAAPVAHALGMPLVLIRKQGKIPNHPYPFHITNEYTSYNMEVDGDLLEKYNRFIYIDDILATGQTLAAVRSALKAKGKDIVFSLHITDVADLKGMRDCNPALRGLPVETVL